MEAPIANEGELGHLTLGRPRALVVGDVLRGFKCAVVLQVRGDAGGAEGVVSDPRLDTSGLGRGEGKQNGCRSKREDPI